MIQSNTKCFFFNKFKYIIPEIKKFMINLKKVKSKWEAFPFKIQHINSKYKELSVKI